MQQRCRAYGAWCHVDAAYGGGLLVSPRRRGRLAGIELADSVAVDFHKTWFQPVSCSALVVRDGSTLGHVTWHADYLNPKESAHPNQVDKSLQTTRRFEALKLWMTLRVMGADAIGEHLDTVIDLTDAVAAELTAMPDIDLAAAPFNLDEEAIAWVTTTPDGCSPRAKLAQLFVLLERGTPEEVVAVAGSWTGQFLNILAVLAVCPLAARLGGGHCRFENRRRAGCRCGWLRALVSHEGRHPHPRTPAYPR